MQLVHSLLLTGLVTGSVVAVALTHRETKMRDVTTVAALMAVVSASKLCTERDWSAPKLALWGYLSRVLGKE